ncbi:hypothetical protein QLX67_02020 [Balneolaceae bacterium ANBcel3]|nr:hypothetical protein [Balneolaceae bacterium ANBcel3]
MTDYSSLILFISAFYATFVFVRFYAESKRIFHICLAVAAFFLGIYSISEFLPVFFPVINSEYLANWVTVFAVSFALSAMAALIREFKPELTRYPRVFTLFPLLLIPVYPMVIETVVLKEYVIFIYKLSAVGIGLLMYGYKSYKDSSYGFVFFGVIFFLLTLILYRIPDTFFQLPEYGWILLSSAGVLAFTIGYIQTNKYVHMIELSREHPAKERWFV